MPHFHLSLVLSQSLSLSLLLSNPSLQSQILFFNLIFRLAKMMPPEQHPSPTPLKNSNPLLDRLKTLDPCAGATSFAIALMGLIPYTAFLLGLAGTVRKWNKRSRYNELWWDPPGKTLSGQAFEAWNLGGTEQHQRTWVFVWLLRKSSGFCLAAHNFA